MHPLLLHRIAGQVCVLRHEAKDLAVNADHATKAHRYTRPVFWEVVVQVVLVGPDTEVRVHHQEWYGGWTKPWRKLRASR